jgi:hypothetical protein
MNAKRTGRREFLRNVMVGGSAAMVALASGRAPAAPATPTATPKAASQGYHVTPHILDYYKAAQF